MKKILILLVVGFIIPQVTFAAWWNPRTWFVPRDTKNLHLEEVIKNDELVPSKEHSAVSTSSLGTSETKIVERVVTKTIPVDRVLEKIVIQSDQSVIDENNLLKIKIKELQAISNQCVVDTEGLQARIKQLEAPLTQAEAQRKATLTSIANMDLEISKVRAGYYDKEICSNNISSCDERWQTSSTIRPPQVLLDKKIGTFEVQKAKLQLELSQI